MLRRSSGVPVVRRAQLLRDSRRRGASPVRRALGPVLRGVDQWELIFPGRLFFLLRELARGRCSAYVGAAPGLTVLGNRVNGACYSHRDGSQSLIVMIWYCEVGSLRGATAVVQVFQGTY